MPVFTPELLRQRLSPFADARRAWIAYSGGMDSTVLLWAMAALRDRLDCEIRALHVDHGLHPDAPAWAEHCARACRSLAVPLAIRRVAVEVAPGESLEAAARARRYAAMAACLGTGDLLLTAQHRDDQAETLLLALLRGSGPAGLAAMPTVAPLGRGRLVRPLLAFPRAELLAYAQSQGLQWLEDPANRDLRFDRNFLRHQVLPLLAQRWPSAGAVIARSAGHCAEAQGVIDTLAAGTLDVVAGTWPGALSIRRLADLKPALRKLVLRRWFRARGRVPPDSRHLERILSEVLPAKGDADPLVAWSGCEVRRYRDQLFALAPCPPPPDPGPLPWRRGAALLPGGLGELVLVAADGRPMEPDDLFPQGLTVRFGVQCLACRQREGGGRRALKKLFQEAGVPTWVRPYFPLLFTGEELVAVGDICRCIAGFGAQPRDYRVLWRSAPEFVIRGREC